MPQTYATVNAQLTGRNKDRRKIANNTYLERRHGSDIALRLHSTDIVTYTPDGAIHLDAKGWHTVTTKDRMNSALCGIARIWSEKGIWMLSLWSDREHPVEYRDGMRLTLGPSPVAEFQQIVGCSEYVIEGAGDDPRAKLRVVRRIKHFVEGYMVAMNSGLVKVPGAGDCMFCLMLAGNPTGTMGTDHLLEHFKESYYVPSLLVAASRRFRLSQAATWFIQGCMGMGKDVEENATLKRAGAGCRDQVKRCLYRYLKSQFGMQA